MEKNKKRKILVIMVASVTIIVLALIGYIIYQTRHIIRTPEETMKEYVSKIEEENYDAMYEYLSEDSKNKVGKDTFLARNKNIYEGIEASNIEVKIQQIEEITKEKVRITYEQSMDTIAGKLSFENKLLLSKEKDKKYYMEWYDNFIMPELNKEDKVRVSTLKAKRGEIYDRDGVLLAGEGTVYSIGLVPGKMSEEEDTDIQQIANLLGISETFIQKSLQASYVKEDTFVPLKEIPKEETALKEALLQIKGIKIVEEKERVYPLGEKTSHLIGYIQNISAELLEKHKGEGYTASSKIGKTGLESIYESRLKGKDGAEIYIVDEKGERKKTVLKQEKQNGEKITLTIDSNMQTKLYNQFQQDKSASVAINPKTGEVLALVSTPSFNNNDFILGMTEDMWNELNNNENKPLYNRYQATWCPGSSFKPIVGSIALTTKAITATENLGNNGLKWQKDSSWGKYEITTLTSYAGDANLRNALIHSDNIYFAKVALKVGIEPMQEQLRKIGFQEEVPFIQTMTRSQYTSQGSISSEIALADTGYGQAQVLVNPLHMATIYSVFVNEGSMIKPYIEQREGKQVEYWKENVFSKDTAETIKENLTQVIENPEGTGHSAKIPGILLAGKTGTAEIKDSKEDTEGTEIGWFNAFIADENSEKQLLVVSMVEDVKGHGGSHYVVDKVKTIFE